MTAISRDISGGCLNPSVGIVQPLFQYFIMKTFDKSIPDYDNTKQVEPFGNMWIYVFAPLIGGMIAGFWQKIHIRSMEAYK
jgi:glycerol uptake facilitator-like aquaporin